MKQPLFYVRPSFPAGPIPGRGPTLKPQDLLGAEQYAGDRTRARVEREKLLALGQLEMSEEGDNVHTG